MQAALRPLLADPPAQAAEPFFPPQLLARLDKNGPRYTSYPTADRYHGGFGEREYRQALRQRREASPVEPLSLYVHIPFCDSVCYYCACNKVVTRHHDRAARYLDALAREISLHVAELGQGVPVSQLHFGGGTPTFLSDDELERLMADLRAAFVFEPDAEISIEVDPRTATPQRLAQLRKLGFNRLSFGVQDFDARVQVAVHRVQSFEDVRDLMQSARTLGYASVNVDLIYGLPLQPPNRSRAPLRRSPRCGPTASPCMPTPTCPSASSRSAASTRRICPIARRASACSARPSTAFSSRATPTSAWIISR